MGYSGDLVMGMVVVACLSWLLSDFSRWLSCARFAFRIVSNGLPFAMISPTFVLNGASNVQKQQRLLSNHENHCSID